MTFHGTSVVIKVGRVPEIGGEREIGRRDEKRRDRGGGGGGGGGDGVGIGGVVYMYITKIILHYVAYEYHYQTTSVTSSIYYSLWCMNVISDSCPANCSVWHC